jgi:CelD/BcsL family acetyltransferase involved in cellulose biosynthesis
LASTDTDHAPRAALERTASAIASARRAVVAERYPVASFAVEWRWIADLIPVAEQWGDLAARALEPNVFYGPGFALAAAGVFGREVGAVLVWSGTQPRRLLGFFPAQKKVRRYGLKLPLLAGWTHSYAPLGTPLVDREAAEPVIAAWLGHLADDASLPDLLLLPLIAEEGPLATMLGAIAKRAQMPYADFSRHRRPLLAPGDQDRAHYVERALSRRRQQKLQRDAGRLAALGALLFAEASESAAVDAALAEFFRLEADGWKGRGGTAAVQDDDIKSFMTAALSALAANGQAAVHRLLLDGRAIAAAITLSSGDNAWLWKSAYDETLARYAPGRLLTAALTEKLAQNDAIARTDSLIAPGSDVLDHFWRERLALCDRLIAVRPTAAFGLACRLERLRGAVIASAKSIRARLSRH